MAAIIEETCASCGKKHILCLLNADLFDATSEYQFVLPRDEGNGANSDP